MFRSTRCALILIFTALAANAQAFLMVDIGNRVVGDDFVTFNENVVSNEPGTLLALNLLYEARGTSWGSDLMIQLYHFDSDTYINIGTETVDSDGVIDCSGFRDICTYNLAWDDTPGLYTVSAVFLLPDPINSIGGLWAVTLADSFSDVGPDGRFLDGSFLSVRSVPVPAAFWLFGSALVGVGALRRRG